MILQRLIPNIVMCPGVITMNTIGKLRYIVTGLLQPIMFVILPMIHT